MFRLVGVTLELHGPENAEKAVVRVPRPLGKTVKISRLGAKMFRISHRQARLVLDRAPRTIGQLAWYSGVPPRNRSERHELSAASELRPLSEGARLLVFGVRQDDDLAPA